VPSGIEHGYLGDDPGGARTESELLIVSPYFIPDAHGIAHMSQMSQRGVRIAVLTNSLASTDSVAAHAGYAGRRLELLRAGVELYEFKPQNALQHRMRHRWGHASPASLHTKLVVQDRARVLLGSLNQDPRSRLHNTESWLLIESRALAAELAAHVEEGTELHHSFRVELAPDATGSDALAWLSSEQGAFVRHETEPMTDAWLRVWRSVLGALIPEHLL
jgi:cardiolipin synthase C